LLDTNLEAEQRRFVQAIHNAATACSKSSTTSWISQNSNPAIVAGADRFSAEAAVHNTLSIIGPRASAKDMTVRNIVTQACRRH